VAESERNPVGRALQMISFLAEQEPGRSWGVRELAAHLGLPVSGIHRTLASVAQEGWVERSPKRGTYRLSLEVFRLALSLTARLPLARIALPVMQDLVAECNETALLGLFDPARLQMSFIAQVESPHPLRYSIELHRWGPLHIGATGLAIFAFLPEALQTKALDRSGLPPMTGRTITDHQSLYLELAAIRERGYAVTKGHRILGSVGIAAPIFGPDGQVIGDLAVTLPEQRYEQRGDERELGLTVMRYAGVVSQQLGADGPPAADERYGLRGPHDRRRPG
jgi:DNA-binding IclR family transcriptional regulator